MKLKNKLILIGLICITLLILCSNKTNAVTITQSYLSNKFNEIKNTSGYKAGEKYTWNDGGWWSDYCSVGHGAWQCHAYGLNLWDWIFNACANCTAATYDVNNLYVGDLVRLDNDGHTIVITDIVGDTIYYTDANWGYTGKVRWDETMSRSSLSSRLTYIKHYSGNNIKTLSNPSQSPIGLKVTTNSASSITVKWNAVSGASKYLVIIYPADRVNKGDWSVRTTSKAVSNATSTTITGLAEGEYYAYVHNYNNNVLGNGSYGEYFRLAKITDVTLNKTSLTLKLGEASSTLTATILPTYATASKTLTWSSSNTNVATVSSSGLITPKGAGTCTITVKTSNSKTATCKITVTDFPFKDVTDSTWYYSSVKYCYDNKIISGTSSTTFSPDTKLTRGMLVTILYNMEGCPAATTAKNFPDVKSGTYYYNPIKWAKENNVVSGYESGKFGPEDKITREQLACILYNYVKYKGKNVSSGLANIKASYKDANQVSSYAITPIQWAVGNGIISGKDNGTRLDSQGLATRAEAVGMIYDYCTRLK